MLYLQVIPIGWFSKPRFGVYSRDNNKKQNLFLNEFIYLFFRVREEK